VGIDPAILDLLRRNPTVVAELASRLSANPTQEMESPIDAEPEVDEQSIDDVYDDAMDLYGDDMPEIPHGISDPGGDDIVDSGNGRCGKGRSDTGTLRGSGQGTGNTFESAGGHGSSTHNGSEKGSGQGKRTPGHTSGRPFISYVGTHLDDGDLDADGLEQVVRMQIEARAIDLIISREPALLRTPEGNPGFDLFEVDSYGKQVRWVEVKSMTGSLEDRPVGLSHTQFNDAREKGDAYWLYVVEYTTDPTKARLLKIQNPVAHARTFTFDHGWCEIASCEEFA